MSNGQRTQVLQSSCEMSLRNDNSLNPNTQILDLTSIISSNLFHQSKQKCNEATSQTALAYHISFPNDLINTLLLELSTYGRSVCLPSVSQWFKVGTRDYLVVSYNLYLVRLAVAKLCLISDNRMLSFRSIPVLRHLSHF